MAVLLPLACGCGRFAPFGIIPKKTEGCAALSGETSFMDCGAIIRNKLIFPEFGIIRSYVKKEYTDIPVSSVVAVVAAILYTLSTIDVIPDFVPVVGYLDDAAVIAFCLNHVASEVEEYRAWRVANGKQLV